MGKKRLLMQALMGGILYFGISLMLEKKYTAEIMRTEGAEAVIFAIVYGAGLWAYYKFIKK
ncbi:hypothetical protein [Robiginitalea sp.]|jgi:hypothetical protein|uniref:hypothetical protein n=1 Tax=Robiginitalea sp. TaxID=1902411 RepID=UPI003C7389F0